MVRHLVPSPRSPAFCCRCCFTLYKYLGLEQEHSGLQTALNCQGTESFNLSLAQFIYWNTHKGFSGRDDERPALFMLCNLWLGHSLQTWELFIHIHALNFFRLFRRFPHSLCLLSPPLAGNLRGVQSLQCCGLYKYLNCAGMMQKAKWVHVVSCSIPL